MFYWNMKNEKKICYYLYVLQTGSCDIFHPGPFIVKNSFAHSFLDSSYIEYLWDSFAVILSQEENYTAGVCFYHLQQRIHCRVELYRK